MLDAQALINAVNDAVDEPQDGTSRWADSRILQDLNDNQDLISAMFGELLRTTDTSLTTQASDYAYTKPATIGRIVLMEVNGKPVQKTSRESLQAKSLHGEISEQWHTDSGQPTHWYEEGNTFYFYPYSDTAGLTIKTTGELLLTAMTDSASSYPFENYAWLRKLQKALVFYTAAGLVESENPQLAARLEGKGDKIVDVVIRNYKILGETNDGAFQKEKTDEDAGV